MRLPFESSDDEDEEAVIRAEQLRDERIQSLYGLTREAFEAMYRQQHGRCAICGTKVPHKVGRGQGRRTLVVDHDHETGAVRGLLCPNCNTGLGMFKDSPENLRMAAEYLIEQ